MYLAIVIPSDKQNFWWLLNGWFLRHSLSINLIYLLTWINKGVSTPCFYICNFNLYSIIIGYTRPIIFLETTYQPFTYTVAIFLIDFIIFQHLILFSEPFKQGGSLTLYFYSFIIPLVLTFFLPLLYSTSPRLMREG